MRYNYVQDYKCSPQGFYFGGQESIGNYVCAYEIKASALDVSRSQHWRVPQFGHWSNGNKWTYIFHNNTSCRTCSHSNINFQPDIAKCAPQILWILIGIMLKGGFYSQVILK